MNFKATKGLLATLLLGSCCFVNAETIFTEQVIETYNVKMEDIENIKNKTFENYILLDTELRTKNTAQNLSNVLKGNDVFVYVKSLETNRIKAHNELIKILQINLSHINIDESDKNKINYLLNLLNIDEIKQ